MTMTLPVDDVVELERSCTVYALKMTQSDIDHIMEH
jgi:hypothetical protein